MSLRSNKITKTTVSDWLGEPGPHYTIRTLVTLTTTVEWKGTGVIYAESFRAGSYDHQDGILGSLLQVGFGRTLQCRSTLKRHLAFMKEGVCFIALLA